LLLSKQSFINRHDRACLITAQALTPLVALTQIHNTNRPTYHAPLPALRLISNL
jgi:hypothetical protein